MAAGSPFTLAVASVDILEPEYHNVVTASESEKKDYQNISTKAVKKYKLKMNLSVADKNTFLAHWNDQYGDYHSFSWQTVPSHIGGGANIIGRWVAGSLSINIIGGLHWHCEVVFEKNN